MKRNSEKKSKILVAMSGGVDSSVAAALLVYEGYNVTGAFMVNYDDNQTEKSCWREDYRDALRVCAKLGIKLLKLNFVKEYRKSVLNYMYTEYEKGRTPNPDVLCNKFVKYGFWLEKAKQMGFDKMATGHYAKLVSKKGGCLLKEAKDKNKDQTYFLHQLNQEQLKHALFPLGKYTKNQVRKLAAKFDLPTASKEESMGICFVGEVPIKQFLQKKIKPRAGKAVLTSGETVGEHEGLPFYTIGQRSIGIEGLKNKISNKKPLFVVDKNFANNELILGYGDDPLLYKKEIKTEKIHWISGQAPGFPLKCQARLRHRQEKQICVVKTNNLIEFKKRQRAAAPGQFVVFYKKGVCLGGGVVK